MSQQKHPITAISNIDDQVMISFNEQWFQEDIPLLCQRVFLSLSGYEIKEKTVGADRENIRFIWERSEFLLNFDFYSQSCWLSSVDVASQTTMPIIRKQLSTVLNTDV